MIFDGGIGIESRRSLSFARYSPEYVLNTLPNAPSAIAMSDIMAKYSQPAPASASGRHMAFAKIKNIPPSIPTIRTTNSTMYAATAALERALFFFWSYT